jgi:hypothetical protein
LRATSSLGRTRQKPVSPDTYRKQADTILRYGADEYGWEASYRAAEGLDAIVALGEEFIAQQEWASAAAVYQGVSTAIFDSYGNYSDDEGELISTVEECIAGLGRCLATRDATIRETILRAIFEIYRKDIDWGGMGLSESLSEIVSAQVTAEERQKIAQWIRTALPATKANDFSNRWQQERYGQLLIELQGELLDDAAFLQICRETGQTERLIAKLLELKQGQVALDEARSVEDSRLSHLIKIFEQHGHVSLLEGLIAERAPTTREYQLLRWLMERRGEAGEFSEALKWAQSIFAMWPSLQHYQKIRTLSEKLENWPKLRPQLLKSLQKDKNLLIEIYLDEKELDRAIELTRHKDPLMRERLEQIARAAATTRPEVSIAIYERIVENLIALRGREAYKGACVYLKQVQKLYAQTDRSWPEYIAELQERHRALRALKEELTKANLV